MSREQVTHTYYSMHIHTVSVYSVCTYKDTRALGVVLINRTINKEVEGSQPRPEQ